MFMLFLFTNTRITLPLKPSLHESEVVQILGGVFVYGIVDYGKGEEGGGGGGGGGGW